MREGRTADAARPSRSLSDADLGLLLGDEIEGAAEQPRISKDAARFERPRPDVKRHCVFAIVASRGGDGKAFRFRICDLHLDTPARFTFDDALTRHALIGEGHQDGAVFLQLRLVGVLDAPAWNVTLAGAVQETRARNTIEVAPAAAGREIARFTRRPPVRA
jgi:hypothetical protein